MIGYQSGLEEFGRSLDERFKAVGDSIDRICDMIELLNSGLKEVEARITCLEAAWAAREEASHE